MYTRQEETVLRLVSTGRNSLDHFVDSLQITCSEARSLTDLLMEKDAVRPQGYYFTRAVSYELTSSGRDHAHRLLADRSELAARHNLLDEELTVLRFIDDPWSPRAAVEARASSIIDGGMQSILVHLHEVGMINFGGTFVVKVALTNHGRLVRGKL